MKKALKLMVALVFSLTIVMSSISISLAAPGKFTVKATVAPTSVTLNWTTSSGAEQYIVQRKQGSQWKKVATVNAPATSCTINKLTTGGTYQYRVCAVDEDAVLNNKTYTDTIKVTPSVGKTTGLKAANYNYNTVKLSWTKQSGVTGYQIYQYNSKTKKYVKVKTVSSKYNYAYIKSLKNGSTYKFKVRAYLKGSKTLYGSYSSVVSVKVAVPTPTVKTSVTYNTAKLSWSKVKDADGYRIYKYDSAKKKWVTAVKSTTKTSYTFKSLKTGTTYSYRVKAYQKTSKNTYWSSYKTVKATPTLSKPTSFKEGVSSLSSLTFTWGKVSGATGYKVYRYNFDTKKWETLKNASAASYTDTNLKAATQYSYRVKAYKKVSGGYTYSPVSSTFRTSTESVNSMGNISVITKTQNSITLSWADIGADGYEIYNAANGKLWMTSDETTVTVGSLNPGVTYRFKIRAYFTENGQKVYSPFSKTVSEKTLEKDEEPDVPDTPVTPAVPSKVTGLQKTSATETSISVKWNASTNATGYILSYKAKSASSWTERSVNSTSYSITGLAAGTQYEIKVTAVNGSTEGTASDVLTVSTESATVTPAVPSKVTGLQKVSSTETSIS
ncbi:MAG: fibronectin type III domain-containing protein, partial [Clostridia bacterium]|nr:fibronectin type III domain-containing protein [Clostridia bacterium]